ncbi:biotin--[acetyl-CoA-carboxylase] ligase [Bacillaceae bacterium Marseille-Q3522]|nr:biotin--[acetyl-CoA-carboxylase] ligase [Bacillaceae bacterium Marseille-Q3522]
MQSEVRKKLLDALSVHKDTFLSGQYLAEQIGCSRAAIWKHIEELRKEGFELEAVRRKGYRIIKTPRALTADEIRLHLHTNFIGQHLHDKDSVTSTQHIAKQLAWNGAEDGTVVIAEEQTAGRGRLARSWYSPKYTGIWMSIILRPNIPLIDAPQLTLLTAVAVAQAIGEVTNLSPEIKWPNDLLINGKKVTGILTELQAEADCVDAIIVGIGINVNQKPEDFSEDLRKTATSLAIEEGRQLSRAELVRQIFQYMENLYLLYLQKGFYPIKLLWESYAGSIGKKIVARTVNGSIAGQAIGINEKGVLMLQDENDQIHFIYSADVNLQ